MKNRQHNYTLRYSIAGFVFGFILIIIGVLLNYTNGFKGFWFQIFEYSPDFIVIVFSPFFLGFLFYFIGFKHEQLVFANQKIKQSLSQEQIINTASDHQIKLLAKIIAQVNEGIVITDRNGKVQWTNEGFTKTNGYLLEEVKGKALGSILHGPLTDKVLAKRMTEKLIIGEAVVEELLTYHKDGSTIWLSQSIKPICDSTGEIVNFIGIQNNITGRKEKEIAIEALYKEVAEYKFALDQSAIVIAFNIEGKIIHVNRKFCEINDLTEEELLGNDYRSISISMRDKAVVKPIWDKLLQRKIWKGELVNRNSNGKTYWTDTIIVPLLNASGEPYKFLAIQQDITERKELEFQLVSNKNKLEQAMQVAKLGSWQVDEKGVLFVSTELRRLYKLPLESPVFIEEIFKNIHPTDQKNITDQLSLCQSSLQKTAVEYWMTINGEEHYMISNINPHIDETGKCIGAFGTVQDITIAKLSALALKKSEEEKAVVFNNIQSIICLHDMNGIILDINAAAEKMSGFSKKEVIGRSLKVLIAAQYEAEFDNYIHSINSNETANGTFEVITKSGGSRIWLYQNTVYKNEGNNCYVIASAVDITETAKAQNEIERQQQFICQIIDSSPNVIFMMNEQRQIMLANKTFMKYYPFNKMENPLAETLSNGKEDIFLGDMDSLFEMEYGQMIRLEGCLRNPVNDTLSWFNIINKCFTEKNGKKYILGFGMDITSKHNVETDLIAANEMVERSLKVKEQFISNMSHEIRTPLNAVVGFTDLLAGTLLNNQQAEYVDIVKTASANLLALINDILDMSKIESGKLSLESMPISINKIVSDVVKILEPKATTKGIKIAAIFDNKLPAKVVGDQLRLTQVMFNLLGNAVKFTNSGSVHINCKLVKGADKNRNYIAFSIKDTGIGVAQNKQLDIFERFSQANTDTQRLYGGTGLGLNITKSIIDLYGGTLTMESETGKGTTFNFILPFQQYVETQNLTPIKIVGNNILCTNTSKPIHILLVEDNMINALLATKVLTLKGFTLLHVVNGEKAMEALQQQHFDVVLMDIQMPVMDGINATIAIRKLKGEVASIPIIAMTAHSINNEMQHCYNAGMNGYVAKPFKTDDLFNTIIELIEKKEMKSDGFNPVKKFKLTA